jgi:hypothetical protein
VSLLSRQFELIPEVVPCIFLNFLYTRTSSVAICFVSTLSNTAMIFYGFLCFAEGGEKSDSEGRRSGVITAEG